METEENGSADKTDSNAKFDENLLEDIDLEDILPS